MLEEGVLMFGWCDDNGASKIFWFETTKGGNQKLVRPDGTSKIIKKKQKMFEEMGPQSLAGWQRAILLMEEYGYWDATAFGCSMNTLIGIRTDNYEDGCPAVYVFSSCQNAERAVYPFLSEEKVEMCRKNVDAFYGNPNIQAAWHNFILHPICLKIKKDSDEVVPVSIEDIGCGQGVLGRYKFSPIGRLTDKESIEFLFIDDEYEDFEE